MWLLFCCWILWMCLVWVEVLCWIDRAWSTKECACCACDPRMHLSVSSICFVYVFVCRKLSPHLRVCYELDHRCSHSLCCFVEWFCIRCGRVRACHCCESCSLVCCTCLPSVWSLYTLGWQCVCCWAWWSERKWTLGLLWIVSRQLSCSRWKSVGISCPLWSSGYECQRVECAFTSPAKTECGMFAMCCMLYVRVSCFVVLYVLSRGGI